MATFSVVLVFYYQVILLNQLAQVYKRITHTAQAGIKRRLCVFRYLLKAEVEEVAQDNYFFLLFG
jgi:hypothetical protein